MGISLHVGVVLSCFGLLPSLIQFVHLYNEVTLFWFPVQHKEISFHGNR